MRIAYHVFLLFRTKCDDKQTCSQGFFKLDFGDQNGHFKSENNHFKSISSLVLKKNLPAAHFLFSFSYFLLMSFLTVVKKFGPGRSFILIQFQIILIRIKLDTTKLGSLLQNLKKHCVAKIKYV